MNRQTTVYYKDIHALLRGLKTVSPLSDHFHIHQFKDTPETWLRETQLFRSNTYSMILLTEGEASYKIGLSEYHIQGSSLYCMAPKHLRYYQRLSETWVGYVVVFMDDFLEGHPVLQQLVQELEGFQFAATVVLPLGGNALVEAERLYEQLHRLAYTNSPLRMDKVRAALELLLCFAKEHYQQQGPALESYSPQQRLVHAFDRAIEDYLYQLTNHQHPTRLTIGAIAQQLFVHPSYLGEVIKEATGHTPKQLLSQRLILEAKALLHNTDLTASQIGDLLHMSDASNFSKFFKRHTGFTPQKYRINSLH